MRKEYNLGSMSGHHGWANFWVAEDRVVDHRHQMKAMAT